MGGFTNLLNVDVYFVLTFPYLSTHRKVDFLFLSQYLLNHHSCYTWVCKRERERERERDRESESKKEKEREREGGRAETGLEISGLLANWILYSELEPSSFFVELNSYS